jgi:hypothetical protein
MSGYKACWVTEKGYVANATIHGSNPISRTVAGAKFIRVEIRNTTDSMIALTNPIYFV